jgi:hypothetical protein
VAVIGSFRQHYEAVLEVIDAFVARRISVLSPPRSSIRGPREGFVRFHGDPGDEVSDHELQQQTLDNILRADCVYVTAPGGYIGRTTLLELGHVRERRIPTFFSAVPDDLPIRVEEYSIMPAAELAELLVTDVATLKRGHLMPEHSR